MIFFPSVIRKITIIFYCVCPKFTTEILDLNNAFQCILFLKVFFLGFSLSLPGSLNNPFPAWRTLPLDDLHPLLVARGRVTILYVKLHFM
jgi:hypothetical protein